MGVEALEFLSARISIDFIPPGKGIMRWRDIWFLGGCYFILWLWRRPTFFPSRNAIYAPERGGKGCDGLLVRIEDTYGAIPTMAFCEGKASINLKSPVQESVVLHAWAVLAVQQLTTLQLADPCWSSSCPSV